MKKSIAILLLLSAGLAPAITFYSTGDPSYNTNAPTGDLAGSGWELQGRFNSFLGTPVGPHHFVAAKHIGGNPGNTFYFNGEIFTTVASVTDESSDLRLWKVAERFPTYAPLYSSSDEVGKALIVFGTGLDRGAAVTNTITTGYGRNQVTVTITNGWYWGAVNYTKRWGTNSVSAVTTLSGYPVLQADWNAGAGDNQCMLADKDSSGAVFIQDNGTWKLAGINYSIGPAATYSFNADGSDPFNATILDFSGDSPLYTTNGIKIQVSQKSSFYSSRISSRYSWLTNNISDFDQDVDGLPDWWEQLYTNSPTALSASADSDGDGFSNLQEYIANTNPTNAASFFDNTGIFTSTNQTLYFDGSTDRLYQVFYTTNDLSSTNLIWIAAHTNWIPGTGTNSSITVSNTAVTAFYRLHAALP